MGVFSKCPCYCTARHWKAGSASATRDRVDQQFSWWHSRRLSCFKVLKLLLASTLAVKRLLRPLCVLLSLLHRDQMLSPSLFVTLLYVERKIFAFTITRTCDIFVHQSLLRKLYHISVISKSISQFSLSYQQVLSGTLIRWQWCWQALLYIFWQKRERGKVGTWDHILILSSSLGNHNQCSPYLLERQVWGFFFQLIGMLCWDSVQTELPASFSLREYTPKLHKNFESRDFSQVTLQ